MPLTTTQRSAKAFSPNSIGEVQKALLDVGYVASRQLAVSVFLMLRLGRPLLLEGSPGTGKTELAKAVSRMLNTELIRLQCYEGLDLAGAAYEWNYARQMIEIRLAGADQSRHLAADDLFTERYLLKRPLLRALAGSDGIAPVLLIDEIDRADEPFEAFLLEFLSDYQLTIPELGTIRSSVPPIVFLTSNRTRDLHDALKRRCLYQWLDYPDAEQELAILLKITPAFPAVLASRVVGFVSELRLLNLQKLPGIAETLEWAAALVALEIADLSRAEVDESLGVLLKNPQDICMVRGFETARILQTLN